MICRKLLTCLFLLTCLDKSACFAQTERVSGFQPQSFALTNATVIPEPGKKIEPGTVVIQNGLITAVGPADKVDVPLDAVKIDAKYLFVYPGLIDAATSLPVDPAKKPPVASARKVDFRKYILAATRPDNRHSLTPTFDILEGLKKSEDLLKPWREAGFTTVHILPKDRIAAGQGALLSSSPGPLRELLLEQNTMTAFELRALGGEAYPNTLMGATAHLRQAFLDARRYGRHWELYRSGSPEVSRPPLDDDLQLLHDVLNQKGRALFRAATRDDIHRALDLAGEFEIPLSLWGVKEAYQCLDRIQDTKTGLLVQVNFGDKPKVEKQKPSKELQTDIKEPERVQQARQDRWRKEVQLLQECARRNIPAAVSSEGLKAPAEVLKELRKAVGEGLTPDELLAALTVHPAKLLNQETRLGKISPGYLGQLLVLNGPLEHAESKTRYVFADGQQFEFNANVKPVDLRQKKKEPAKADLPKEENAENQKQQETQDLPSELEVDRKTHAPKTGGNLFVHNATVLTATGKTLKNTSLLIKNGKISAIGADLKPPKDVALIDATGLFVMPGIIDTHSHIMVTGGLNESSQSVVSEVRIKDVINTADVSEYRALAGGVTTARILHGSANVIGGQDAVVKLKYGHTAREHLLKGNPQGIKFALGENVKRRTNRFPNTRLGVEATLNRAFMEALDYRNRWRQYELTLKKNPELANKLLAPRTDLRLRALTDILNHEMFIHSHCYRSDEILMLLRVASGLGIRVWSLQHVLEGYKVAPEIVKHGASCSTFADWWAYKIEAFDATPYNAALLSEAGANVVIKSDDWELIRHLYYEAAKPMKYGNLNADLALQTVTLNAARELGIDDRMGSIEIGKDGDLGIYNGHPFQTFSRCEYTVIDGEIFFSRANAPTAMSAAGKARTKHAPEFRLGDHGLRTKPFDIETAKLLEKGKFAIVGATLHPVDQPPIPSGTLLVENGKIVGVEKGVNVPTDYRTIDARGLHVYPGLIDAGTTLGLTEIGQISVTHDHAESGNFQPDLRAGVAINPDSELIPVARAGGITTILMRPDGGLIAGQTSVAKLAGWTAPEMVLNLESGLQIIWPRDGNKNKIEEVSKFLEQGRVYAKLKEQQENAKKKQQPNEITLTSFIPDPRFDALIPYLAGEKPTHIEANSRKQIAQALEFAEKEKLDIIITGGTDAWKLAKELKERNVPVIVGPVMRKPMSETDPQDAPYANPGLLHEAGVEFCIRSDDSSNSRNVPFEAAMAVAHGLPAEAALKAVTLNSAKILGLEKELGSLTVGKRATFILTDGNPLQIPTQIKCIWVDGKPHSPSSRQTRFYERYRERLNEFKAANTVTGSEE